MFVIFRPFDAGINKTHISLYLLISYTSNSYVTACLSPHNFDLIYRRRISEKTALWYSIWFVPTYRLQKLVAGILGWVIFRRKYTFKVLWALNLSRIRSSKDLSRVVFFVCNSLDALTATERQLTAHESDTSFYSEQLRKANQQTRCSVENTFEKKLRRSYWF